MSKVPAKHNQRDFKADLLRRLNDPVQLRMIIFGGVFLVGYCGIYLPLGDSIVEASGKLKKTRKHQTLVHEVENLRIQYQRIAERVPPKTDNNEWAQYVLEGVRQFPLKLVALDSDDSERVGRFSAVVLKVQLEGSFAELDRFLHWLEVNDRIFRVDSIKLAPVRTAAGTLLMQLTVLGVTH